MLIRAIAISCLLFVGSISGSLAKDKQIEETGKLIIGSSAAPVTMIIYSSLTCPHCASFHNEKLPVLIRKYVDSGKLAIEFQHFPLDPFAMAGAMLTQCFSNDDGLKFVEKLFYSQDSWLPSADPSAQLRRLARQAGLSRADYDACLKNEAILQAIRQQQKVASDNLDLSHVPAFFIGSESLVGNQSLYNFYDFIDAGISKKKAQQKMEAEARIAAKKEAEKQKKEKAEALLAAQQTAAEADKLIAVGSGSSFAVNAEGIFISNQHVIDGCSKIELMKSGQPLEALVVASDERNDLALIQLSDPLDQKVFFRLSDEPIKVMDGVFVGGFPFGNLLGKNVKVTSGIVSSMAGINDDVSQLMIDAAIQPGNSGGPIFLRDGKLAAVTVASLDSLTILKSADTLPQNTNFGIKLSVVREFLSANNVTIPEQSFFTRDFEETQTLC